LKQSPKIPKKLIEVSLPLEAINEESLRRKQKAPKGYPTSFHKWWAQRPLAACRAVLFASLVDDPSEHPELFSSVLAQSTERERLLSLMGELIKWDNYQDERLYEEAWQEIVRYTKHDPPTLYDPFAGGGSIPLEGQRLGLETYASDLNPVAVLINKAMLEIPATFSGMEPVNPRWRTRAVQEKSMRGWRWAQGLADDVRYYGNWMREQAVKEIGELYPPFEITEEIVANREDLREYLGEKLSVVAWIWARSVKSPNPAFADIDVPLASSFVLSSKPGKEAFIRPVIEEGKLRFDVRRGKSDDPATASGTKMARGANFRCLMSGIPIEGDYVKAEGVNGRLGAQLLAAVAEGSRGRVFLSPTVEMEHLAKSAKPTWQPETRLPHDPRNFWTPAYGLAAFGDLFSNRQLVALTTFTDLVLKAREQVKVDALKANMEDDELGLEDGGVRATAYADAIAVYLGCVVDRMVYYGSTLTTWLPKDNALRDCMPRQALAMTWDFAECNPLGKSSGDVITCASAVANYLDFAAPRAKAKVFQSDAAEGNTGSELFFFSTDPPYYDNISYADLSEYFYVWLRRSLKPVLPRLFARLEVPKVEELVAAPYRHGGDDKAEAFFMTGMSKAMSAIALRSNPQYPVTIYYAFKQAESDEEDGATSSGWETFLEAVIRAGFAINGTWPIRTEGAGRMIAKGTNALGSSIVLVCRPSEEKAPVATRREFLEALRLELPAALASLQEGNILPVDLAQAAIGPGMAVYTRFGKVIDADGNVITVGQAFSIINRILDEVLAEQEGDFDVDTRWALAWFEQFGYADGSFGTAEMLSKAKNTSVDGMVDAGILASRAGKVRLLLPEELPGDWDPSIDGRLTVWETVHHLIRTLAHSEASAAVLAAKLGSHAEVARELAYRLDNICKNQNRSQERLAYNSLVQSWPEIMRLARQSLIAAPGVQTQRALFSENV
jgi:putative DNA methylase